MGVLQVSNVLSVAGVNGTQSSTFPSNLTVGSGVVVLCRQYSNNTLPITGVTAGGSTDAGAVDRRFVSGGTDSYGDVWSIASVASGTNAWSVDLPATGAHDIVAVAIEVDGLGALQTSGIAGPVTDTSPTATTDASTSSTPVLLVGMFGDTAASGGWTSTPPASWTELFDSTANLAPGSAAYFEDSGVTGSKTGTFAITSAVLWRALIAAYTMSAGGGGAGELMGQGMA